MTRGQFWDALTLGPRRRQRAMQRRLRELDRLDAGAWPKARRRWPGTLLRIALFVGVAVAGISVFANSGLGLSLGLSGQDARPLGEPPAVAKGLGTFEFLRTQQGDSGDPVTYSPCSTIRIVVNDAFAPPGADRILSTAVDRISSATGLRIEVQGKTDEKPRTGRPLRDPGRYGSGWAPVLVSWTTPSQVPGLEGRVAGQAGSAAVSNVAGLLQYVTGNVDLDSPALAEILRQPGGRAQAIAIVTHELGHLVGLAHVFDPRELMNEDNIGLTDFGPGDREGLAALGAGRCL